jgi:thiol:disulfide interchange protein
MKRPFAVIGFSMLAISLLIMNLNFKMTILLLIGTMVIFFACLLVKKLRKDKAVIFSLMAVIIYSISFIFAQVGYYNEKEELQNTKEIIGTICETPVANDTSFSYVVKLDNKRFKIRRCKL